MKNNSKLCSILATICVICAMVCVAALVIAIFDGRTKFESIFTYGISFSLGGFLSSFIISWWFYCRSVKKEIAEAVEKTKKDVEENLNKQFNQYRGELLNKVHDKSTESLLRKYKTVLVDQLEADMAKIWNVRPGANTSATLSQVDPTAMNNADDKYYKMLDSISKHSEDLFNSILNDNGL